MSLKKHFGQQHFHISAAKLKDEEFTPTIPWFVSDPESLRILMGDRATVRPIGNPMENILAQEAKITANNTKNSVDVFILFAKRLPSF